jgi:peptidoglycan/LPS O-acetylase OafA/YrhL
VGGNKTHELFYSKHNQPVTGSIVNKSKSYYLLLDPLRWMLASMVILFHFWAWTPEHEFWLQNETLTVLAKNGFLGVDAFFVISGIAICHSVKKRTPSDFLKMRASRLVPTFLCVSTIETLLILILKFKGVWGESFGQVVVSGITNVLPISGKDSNLRNFVAWSLGVEILFYFSIYLATVIYSKLDSKKYDLESIPRIYLQTSILLIYVYNFAGFESLSSLLFLKFLPYFLLGILLELSISSQRRFVFEALCLLPILGKLVFDRCINESHTYKENLTTLSILLCLLTLIMIALLSGDRFLKRVSNELKEVGLASYFLFLVGGKFGIIIFTNNQNIGIFQSMIFTYLLCAAMSILYQRFINRRLTTFIFRNRTT